MCVCVCVYVCVCVCVCMCVWVCVCLLIALAVMFKTSCNTRFVAQNTRHECRPQYGYDADMYTCILLCIVIVYCVPDVQYACDIILCSVHHHVHVQCIYNEYTHFKAYTTLSIYYTVKT